MIPLSLLLAVLEPAQTQIDMTQQAGHAAAVADAAMNAQYRQTMTSMKKLDAYKAPDATTGPSYQHALLAAQRAWLTYRDAECTVQGYEFRGGSASPMAHAQCIAALTRARTAALKTELWSK